MSTNFKTLTGIISFVLIASLNAGAQATIEVVDGSMPAGQGPSTANYGPISLQKDANSSGATNNIFTPTTPAEATSVTFKLLNQQYTANYSNLTTGLVFGARSTTAVGPIHPAGNPGVQRADGEDFFNILGSFISTPGGPTGNFFTSHSTVNPGQGIISIPSFDPLSPDFGKTANGAASVFTAAQIQYDQGIQNNPAPVPTAFNAATRYHYGDLLVEFNRFVRNPVIHIAGLGGSYQYIPFQTPALDPSIPSNWRRTQFSTELEVVGFPITYLSGNSSFQVSGTNGIINTSSSPDGASVSTGTSNADPIDHIGAASGSVRVNGTARLILIRVYLRGNNITNAATQFAWSAPGTASNNSPTSIRNPLTGDTWWISVSTEPSQLIPLAATGVNLSASLTGNDVALSWKTLTEINSNRFDIERSTDGINFTKIGEKAAAGYSNSDVNYSYADAGMNVSVYYYRLKLVDLDGKVSYSNIAAVRKSSIKTIKVFPNPAVENLSVEFSNAKGSYTVTLLNQAGQEVQNIKADISNTVQYVKINRNNVAAGMYYVRVKENNTGEVMSEKVVIK
jgi:hypothetical protein